MRRGAADGVSLARMRGAAVGGERRAGGGGAKGSAIGAAGARRLWAVLAPRGAGWPPRNDPPVEAGERGRRGAGEVGGELDGLCLRTGTNGVRSMAVGRAEGDLLNEMAMREGRRELAAVWRLGGPVVAERGLGVCRSRAAGSARAVRRCKRRELSLTAPPRDQVPPSRNSRVVDHVRSS